MNQKPNIIFFFSDQQRWDTAGCYGQPLDITPHLDALAAEGVKFQNAYTCQPVCGPARACLQTGKYATTLGCYRNNIALPSNEKTIAHYLNEAGYRTGYVGKWHLASTGSDSHEKLEAPVEYIQRGIPKERRGGYKDFWIASDVLEDTSHGYGGYLFDENNEKVTFTGYRTDAVTDFALSYVETWEKDEPHFLFISHIEPHHQNDRNHFEGPIGSREKFADFVAPKDLEEAPGEWGSNWKTEYPDYLGCCHQLDKNLGRLMECLKEKGLADDTIVIYTSDHGSHFKTRTVEYKRSCHDASIHIPLVIRSGKNTESAFKGGKCENALVSLIDLPPTILRMAGCAVPDTMQGRAIQEIEEIRQGQRDETWQKEVFLQISESQVGRCIRTQKYKYSVRAYDKNSWLDAKAEEYREEYLYDLEKDPHELHNLVSHPDYESVREQLRTQLIQKMVSVGEEAPVILPAYPYETAKYGMKALFTDLLHHPNTAKTVTALLPEAFVKTDYETAVSGMTAEEVCERFSTLLGAGFRDKLLEALFYTEVNI